VAIALEGGGGYWNSPYYYGIAEIIKTDSLGNQEWKKTYGNPLFCNLEAMVCLSKDSCILSAYSNGYSAHPYINNNSQIYLIKIGLDGVEKWNKKIGLRQPNNWASWICTLTDGSIVVSGGHRVEDTINKVIGSLFKLNANGDSIWYREYAIIQGPLDANQLWHFTPTPDGGFAGAGSLYPLSSGGTQDIWVFKTDSMGCLVPNCHVGLTEFNPNAGAKMLVFPNPFSNAFAINYNIPKESNKGVFELRDIMGKLVYSTPLTINVNQLQVVASALKPGLYFASLVVDGVLVSTEKLIKN
jgi:hypothetical protein